MKLSVGNLPQSLDENELKEFFMEIGTVEEVSIKRDKKTKTSLGYGYVIMPDDVGKLAIEKLNGKEIAEKKIVVVDSIQLQKEMSEKNKNKPTNKNSFHNSKLSGSKKTGGGFSGTGIRKTGGNRGK